MESLSSRHFNRKLSNGFSGINAYGDMFSVPAKDGAQKISSRVEDYKQIFGGSNVSSIPVLDLSDQNETSRLGNFRSSEADYSDIFGGFSDEVIGVSYEDLVSPSGDRIFSGNVRTRSAIGSPMKRSDSSTFPKENQLLSSEASFLSFEDKKHFNMSYHKTSAGSKDGSNRTIHVTQFHPEPGFAFFVDDSIPQESKADKPDFPVTSDIRRKLDFSDGILEDKYNKKAVPQLDTQRSSRRETNSRTKFKQDGSNSSDKLLNADVIDCRPHLTKVRLPPRVAANLDKNNGSTKRSTVSNSEAPEEIAYEHATGDDGSLPFFGEELDVNSAAAVSAAALKDAIQKAQKSIRIAKELMERKKGGLRNRSNQVFKDGLKLKDRKENSIAHEENRTDNTNARGTFENVDSLLNVFSGRRKSASRHGQNAPDFIHNERTSTSGKVTSLHAQNRATSEKREPALSTILNIRKNRTALSSPDQQAVSNSEIVQFMDKQDYDVEERNITRETLMKQEVIIEKKEHDEEDRELGFIKKKIHDVVMDNELEASVDKSAKHVEMEKPIISQKDGDCEKTEIESQQKIEYEMKFESHALKDSDYEKMIPKTQKQDHNKENVNSQQEYIEKTTLDIKEEPDRPIIICDEDIEEERFEDASEWVQNEDEPKDSHSRESNEDGKEVIRSERRLAEVHDLTIEEKRSIDVHDRKESGQNFGKFELKGSENGFKSYGYEKIVNIQTGTKKIEALQQVEYESGVNRETVSSSHDASDNITETQGACQPYMIGESLIAKQQLDDNGRSIDKATKDFHDFKAGGAEEAKVAYKVNKMELFETDSLVQGAIKESEDMNNMDTVFEVLPSEGSIPKFGLTDMDNENTESAQRDKDSESNMNLDNGAQISVNGSTEKGFIFEEDEIYWDEKAVKSGHDISNKEGHHVVIIKNSEADPGPSLSSEIEKVIQVDKEMRERQNTQVNGESYCKTIGEEEEETKSDVEMKTENVKQVNDNNPKEVFAIKRTETEKAVSKGVEENEYLRKIYEESKRERQREIDRIVVERAIQDARDRAVAGARERAERAAVERATAEVRQRVMAEARGKLEKATTAAKPSAEKAKLRSERAAVERATEEARARALEKALSHKTTSRAQTDKDLQRYDETYIESAQRNKARLEREERITERAAKALAEKNMRDLLAQKEEAEKSRLAESLQTEIKRWSTGKEGNLRALLSTLQYILGPGSGWQPISLTDIITSDAVKKAYRKATLYVHPDKLQQRGASIREKYICEKVFDLLKVAWNRFSSEER